MRTPLTQVPLTRSLLTRISAALLPALAFFILCVAPSAFAQQTPNTEPPPSFPGVNPRSSDQDEATRRMAEQMAIKRNSQRQQQIVADTAHLLDLAQKLNTEVSKSDKNTLSISVVKEAEEIEKLAKSIKERMRDGT